MRQASWLGPETTDASSLFFWFIIVSFKIQANWRLLTVTVLKDFLANSRTRATLHISWPEYISEFFNWLIILWAELARRALNKLVSPYNYYRLRTALAKLYALLYQLQKYILHYLRYLLAWRILYRASEIFKLSYPERSDLSRFIESSV